jgi:hypothetical protein
MQPFTNPVASGVSDSSSSESRGSRKRKLNWLYIRHPSLYFYPLWREALCIALTAFRSLCGHIRTQLPIGPQVLDLGQSILRDGILRPTSRALARREYIQIVRAIYPWVDIVDRRIFLMGFDAGEQWGVCNRDIPEETPTVQTWLPSEKSSGHVPTRVLKSIAQAAGKGE